MSHLLLLLLAWALGAASAGCGGSFYTRESRRLLGSGQPGGVVAIVNANVIPMDSERVLAGHTVLVRDGVITEVGPSTAVAVPAGAHRIEASGQYLMPGLIDMHVHVVTDRRDLFLYVANGVTSVRNMAGFRVPALLPHLVPILDVASHVRLREQIRRDEAFGPNLFTTGPQLDGDQRFKQPWPLSQVVTSPAAAERAVEAQKRAGYDFVKVYHALQPPVYERIVEAAARAGLKVVGHVPLRVGIGKVLRSRPTMATIEHLNGYIDHFHGRTYFPPAELEAHAALTRQAGIWVCPTLVVWTSWIPDQDLPLLTANPNLRYVSPTIRRFWLERVQRGKRVVERSGGTYPSRNLDLYRRVALALHRAGVPLLLGTDSVSPFIIPGFSVHQELGHLVAAGLTPYEALRTGTTHAAAALGQAAKLGGVRPGQRADLLLLEANPLADVRHAQRRVGVMLRGRWYPERLLRETLGRLERSFGR